MTSRIWNSPFVGLARIALHTGVLALAFSGFIGAAHAVLEHADDEPGCKIHHCDLCSKIQGNPAEGNCPPIILLSRVVRCLLPDPTPPWDIHFVVPSPGRAPPLLESIC